MIHAYRLILATANLAVCANIAPEHPILALLALLAALAGIVAFVWGIYSDA